MLSETAVKEKSQNKDLGSHLEIELGAFCTKSSAVNNCANRYFFNGTLKVAVHSLIGFKSLL